MLADAICLVTLVPKLHTQPAHAMAGQSDDMAGWHLINHRGDRLEQLQRPMIHTSQPTVMPQAEGATERSPRIPPGAQAASAAEAPPGAPAPTWGAEARAQVVVSDGAPQLPDGFKVGDTVMIETQTRPDLNEMTWKVVGQQDNGRLVVEGPKGRRRRNSMRSNKNPSF